MHGYLSNGYLNSPSNFNYEKVGKIVSLRTLLAPPWTMTKIALNIMKLGVHSYLSNAHINLWSNFNSKKLVKSKTPLCDFSMVGIKWGENISESYEISHARELKGKMKRKRCSNMMGSILIWCLIVNPNSPFFLKKI